MTEKPTTFEAVIEKDKQGGWSWSIKALLGPWPNWLSGRDSPDTSGETFTKWGARKAARRALRTIRRHESRGKPEIIR